MGHEVADVEHDEDTIQTVDHVLDLGPGIEGGEVVAQEFIGQNSAAARRSALNL